MTNIDHLLDRNRAFAGTDARQNVPALPFLPRQALYIVICIDGRVDPARTLGLELGPGSASRRRTSASTPRTAPSRRGCWSRPLRLGAPRWSASPAAGWPATDWS